MLLPRAKGQCGPADCAPKQLGWKIFGSCPMRSDGEEDINFVAN